jgi:hypothetical protein
LSHKFVKYKKAVSILKNSLLTAFIMMMKGLLVYFNHFSGIVQAAADGIC